MIAQRLISAGIAALGGGAVLIGTGVFQFGPVASAIAAALLILLSLRIKADVTHEDGKS